MQGSVYDLSGVQSGFEFAEPETPEQIFPKAGQQSFLDEAEDHMILSAREKAARDVKTATGELHLEKLFKQFPRLSLVNLLSQQFKFHHWELAFADIFKDQGGFDIILGNPPWLKVEWNETGVLGDFNPKFVLRKFDSSKLRAERSALFANKNSLEKDWLNALVEAEGTQKYLNSLQNYPELRGVQSNLYKCFLPQCWRWGNTEGFSGLLHPEGVYDDPKGGGFRADIYAYLRMHFQFQNQNMLFPIGHRNKFSINIYGPKNPTIDFQSISNIFSTSTIDASILHDGQGQSPGIKTESGSWETRGHRNRVLDLNISNMQIFAKLYDTAGTPTRQATLPTIHSTELLSVLRNFAFVESRLGDFEDENVSLEMWHETKAQRDDILRRQTGFPKNTNDWVLSGPHFYVGTPYYKTPRKVCREKADYDILDLTDLPQNYLPRSNYVPKCEFSEYKRKTPKVPWIEPGEKHPRPVTDYNRLVNRRMFGVSAERSLVGSVIPKNIAHIHTVVSTVFRTPKKLVNFSGCVNSIVFDFFLKTTGKSDLYGSLLSKFPYIENELIAVRTLGMFSLTSIYSKLWNTCWNDSYNLDNWSSKSSLLNENYFNDLGDEWSYHSALRSDFERRQALVEIDVLVSIFMSLSIEELLTIYRVQFPVLRQNERETQYDINGRIIFTPSKGLVGVGLARKANKKGEPLTIEFPDGKTETKPLGWEDIAPNADGSPTIPDGTKIHRTVMDDTLPGGPREKIITYVAPFYRPDREEDYRVAWEVFTERFAQQESKEKSGGSL